MVCKKVFVKRFALYALAAFSLAMPFSAGAVVTSLVDDCEGGSNENKFHQYWYGFDDNKDGGNSDITNYTKTTGSDGASKYTVSPIAGEGHGGGACYRIDYTKGTKTAGAGTGYNFVGIGTMLSAEGQTLDLTGASKITFWAKASAATVLNVEIATSDITDFAYYKMTPLPEITTTWAQYSMILIKGTGVAQPSGWGVQKPLDLTKAEKIQWQVHWNNPVPLTTGKLWIDDVIIEGYNFVYKPREACATCVGAVGTQTTPSALFSNFETTPVNRNAAGLYWYCYNDAAGRNVMSQTEFSDISSGAVKNPDSVTAPPTIQIGETGQGGGKAATIEYQLGPGYTQGATTIKPFVGIGSSLSDKNKTMFYNATGDGAKGVYFEYQCTGVPYLRFEVQTSQVFPNAGIVFHRLLPATTGTAWASAYVPFDSLMLPNWTEVTNLSESARKLKLTEISQIQWAVQGDPNATGKLSIDNVYFVGATTITAVGTGIINRLGRTSLVSGITAHLVSGAVVINLPAAQRGIAGTVAIVNAAGVVMSKRSLSEGKSGSLSLDMSKAAKGMYFLRLNVNNEKTMTTQIPLF